MPTPILDGITPRQVSSARIETRVLFSGPEDGTPVLFLHGNASSATYWEAVMLALPDSYRGIAPDQRGYGDADPAQKINATRGVGDLADDAFALLDALKIDAAHVVGHSAGGSVIWQMMMDQPARLRTVTLVAPGSPYGFGGTKGLAGTPVYDDHSCTGAGTVNPGFVNLLAAGDRSEDDPQGSPRVVMNTFYWKPPFRPEREEDLLTSLLSTHVGEQDYPGDVGAGTQWLGFGPGSFGMINALTPKYLSDPSALLTIAPKPPVLWVRGSDDQIVSDMSMFDLGTLGKLGALPNYPGEDVHPPQPMVSQTRAVLERYAEAGGSFREEVIADTGHTPYIEKPDVFNALLHAHLAG